MIDYAVMKMNCDLTYSNGKKGELVINVFNLQVDFLLYEGEKVTNFLESKVFPYPTSSDWKNIWDKDPNLCDNLPNSYIIITPDAALVEYIIEQFDKDRCKIGEAVRFVDYKDLVPEHKHPTEVSEMNDFITMIDEPLGAYEMMEWVEQGGDPLSIESVDTTIEGLAEKNEESFYKRYEKLYKHLRETHK